MKTKPDWFTEADDSGLIDGEWKWDEVMEEWSIECSDCRFDGSHEVWTVTEHEIELECGSFAARSDIGSEPVAVMHALAACVDAFNIAHNNRSRK